jgi:hypothetical protein
MLPLSQGGCRLFFLIDRTLEEMKNASLRRSCLSTGFWGATDLCVTAHDCAMPLERGLDFREAGHPRDHPLHIETALSVAEALLMVTTKA